MRRRFTVVCEWRHLNDDCVFDADEVQVVAESAGKAITAARRKWKATICETWPEIALERAWILTPARRRSLD